uniref:Uncharacterized protein n=1 Tax=Brassica oleracea TaxID=3712 RepID=A0A3P6FT47_BRAOL|nr:unnamed protein product [Brassica oleracea]
MTSTLYSSPCLTFTQSSREIPTMVIALQFSLQPTLDHSMEGSSLKKPSILSIPLLACTGFPRFLQVCMTIKASP